MAKINIEGEEEVLQDILESVVSHFNEKQDNFSMTTEGLKLDTERVHEKKEE